MQCEIIICADLRFGVQLAAYYMHDWCRESSKNCKENALLLSDFRPYFCKPLCPSLDYLKNRNPIAHIPFRKNGKSSGNKSHKKYDSVRYVAERFFGWLKNGFHRTGIKCEKRRENYLAFVSIASFLMYCRVLR